jgi:hypothetical protein
LEINEVLEMKTEKGKRFTLGTLLTVGLVVGLLVAMQTVPNSLNIPGWNTIASASDGNPGTGASGVLEIFIYAHQAVPATAYAANLSSVSPSCYASRNTLNGACTGNVPYATTFDIVVKCRYNATHAYNTTGSVWMLTWVKGLITSANLAIGADTQMTAVQIGSNATYLWVNFWIADSDGGAGSGFTITHGQVVNATSFKMQAYF